MTTEPKDGMSGRPHLDVIDVLRFEQAKGSLYIPKPIATIIGAVTILPNRRYILMVTSAAITFKLSVGGTGAADGTDMSWPVLVPLIFDSGSFDTFHADSVNGMLQEISLT